MKKLKIKRRCFKHMRKKHNIQKAIRILIALLCAVITVFPIYWMFVTSLKNSEELLKETPSLLLNELHFENYLKVLNNSGFWGYLKNTIIATLGIVTLQIVTSVAAAYGLAIGKFKYKKLIFALIIGAMIIPEQITFIPLYISFAKLGLVNTFIGLILPEAISPFLIYLLFNAFSNVDKSLIEAAKMDGLNKIQLLINVYIPVNISTFITTILLSFINGWNAYFWPKIITNNESHRVITIGIAYLKTTLGGDIVSNYNEVMAGVLMSIIPIIILFVLFQKHIMGKNEFGGE